MTCILPALQLEKLTSENDCSREMTLTPVSHWAKLGRIDALGQSLVSLDRLVCVDSSA